MGVKLTSRMSLAGLSKQLEGVRSPDFRLRMARVLAEEARTQTSDGFQQQRDPYGKAWQPLKHRRGMILQDTGRMAAAVATSATSFGFRIDIPVKYAAPHQYGARAHARRGGAIPQNRRGQFMSKRRAGETRGRRQKVAIFSAYTHGGIPQRQMIPMTSTGGLGPIWTAAFNRTATKLLDQHFKGAA